jgi:HlyD family secretion protein
MPNMAGPPRSMRRAMQGDLELAAFQRPQLPDVTDADCQKVRAALTAKPAIATELAALRRKMQSGEVDPMQLRSESQKLYASLGVDAGVARACQMRAGAYGSGASPAGGDAAAPPSSQAPPPQGRRQRSSGDAGASLSPQPRGEFPMRTRTRPGVVFVAKNGTFEPRVVRLGLGNFDYTEVLSGLSEGDEVALLGAAAIQASRDSSNARFRQMTGGGMPGMQRQQGGAQGGAAAGGQAGGRPRQ